MKTSRIAIGCAAGFSGDRTDAAAPVVRTLIRLGLPSFLIFEMLAERTLALAQLRRRADPSSGYEVNIEQMIGPVLGACLANDIRIVSNFGSANPRGAALRIRRIAQEQGLPAPRIAIISGDDLSDPLHAPMLRTSLGPDFNFETMVSANAYIGAESIAAALREGAQIVVAGRIADPSLVVGPALASFDWALDDWDRIARATMIGHLLECGAQVSGGYFADPGYKDVPDLHAVGFPVAELDIDGVGIVSKADGTGGCVTTQTVKEQLLYEIHDPTAYLTPDVVADIGSARVTQVDKDRVQLEGVRGHPRPTTLKVNVCREGGWLAEGEISYAGPGAESRARLAAQILGKRLPDLGLRTDLIGVLSVFADDGGALLAQTTPGDAKDVRLRVAATHSDRRSAERLLSETTALYTCGPAGGGGVRTSLQPRLNMVSCLVPAFAVPTHFEMLD